MIIGTAGHIDHGKTSLVRALTGVDTDRLKEERERGISIELGYAYHALPDGDTLGFIDVPGHEKLVRTMVAGATGIDFALLVVAADDGVMPQTVEHLEILQLLGLDRGAVAITKIDTAAPGRVEAVRAELGALLAGTGLADAPVFPVCAPSDAGIDALRGYLHQQAMAFRRPADGGFFRLAIDRSFTLTGIGTVVTGTVFSGTIGADETVRLLPGGPLARVRHVRAQNRDTGRGASGQRCALNLASVPADAIERGMWAVDPELDLVTERLDARVRLLARESRPLKHWSPVHVHLGAAHVIGRVALLDCEELAPGASALAQFVLARPVHAVAGDRLILRDASALRTIGGGFVVDPQGPPRRRKTPERLARLTILDQVDPDTRLETVVRASPYGVDLGAFRRSQNVRAPALDAIADCLRVPPDAPAWLVAREHWDALAARLTASLADYHGKTPDEIGLDAGRLRRVAFPNLDPEIYQHLLDEQLGAGAVRRSGPWVHLPDHVVRLTPDEEALAKRVLPIIDRGGFDPPWVRDLARLQAIDEERMRKLLKRLARQGELFQVVKDLFYAKGAVTRLADLAAELARESGAVKAAEFRDRTGLGRKRAIQVLEFFDRVGYTRRARDTHRIRGDALLQLGSASGPASAARAAAGQPPQGARSG
jgi:selenocysteine-specific elongation factor